MNAVAVWAVPGHEDEARDFMRRAGLAVPDNTTSWMIPVTGGSHEKACDLVAERFGAVDARWPEFVTIRRVPAHEDKEN